MQVKCWSELLAKGYLFIIQMLAREKAALLLVVTGVSGGWCQSDPMGGWLVGCQGPCSC